jgi:hypothetical protein
MQRSWGVSRREHQRERRTESKEAKEQGTTRGAEADLHTHTHTAHIKHTKSNARPQDERDEPHLKISLFFFLRIEKKGLQSIYPNLVLITSV